MYRCAITAPRVTRTGTYGTGRAPYRGCIGLHLILYSIHNTETYRRCARSHANTPPVKKLAPLTTRSSSLRCVSKVCIDIYRYTNSSLVFAMNATYHINVVFHKFAYSLMSRVIASPNCIVSAIVNSDAYHQSPLIDKWESMLYV